LSRRNGVVERRMSPRPSPAESGGSAVMPLLSSFVGKMG